jgi:hypothetical protein
MLSPTIFFFHELPRTVNVVTDIKYDKKPKKGAHHIVQSDFFVMNEIAVADKIRDLNTSECCPQFYIFDTVERLKISENNSLNSNTNILKSTSTKLLLTFEKCELMYLDLYLKSLSCSKKYIKQLIEFYRSLLKTIHLLVENNLIHNNINFNTIVINLAVDNPLLTNFSYTIDLLNKPSFKEEYWSQYFLLLKTDMFSPVEFYLLQYQLTNKSGDGCLSLYNIETILKQFIKDHAILGSFSTTLLLEDGLKFFAKYANKSFNKNLEEALKYAFTWDNYALSIVYLEILIGLHRTISAKNDINGSNKFIISFMKLLVNNISLDPSKRSLTSLTASLFEDMVTNILVSDYQELLKSI